MSALPEIFTSGEIISRMPAKNYFAMPGLSITRLKELRRSPQHYKYRLETPKESAPLTLGRAAHCAVLEPHRLATDFAVWSRRTKSGNLAPRNGQWWEAFQDQHSGREIINEDDKNYALAIREAVHAHPDAARYLAAGEPEVVMTWDLNGRPCRGRADWITPGITERVSRRIAGTDDFEFVEISRPYLVGLKTARDCRHFAFGAQAARLGYHLQWAWYLDGYKQITGVEPGVVEIVVETEEPHAVAVYSITDDILEQGRSEYDELLVTLDRCEKADDWHGPVPVEEPLTLPTWAYPSTDDLAELGLEQ